MAYDPFGDDILARNDIGPRTAPSAESSFTQGLRSGIQGAGGQLSALAGMGAEALGADEAARGLYGASRGFQERAQAYAPPVSSFKDVEGLGSAFDYATGLIGQSLPQIAAATAAGVLTRGRSLVPTLSMAPFEIGEQVQRQQADPTSLREDPWKRAAVATGTGLLSSALQSYIPAKIGGQVAGTAAKQAAKETIGQITKRNLLSIPEEAFFEAGGEAAQQAGQMVFDPSRKFDIGALAEAAVGGAAAGTPLAGVGTAADIAHGRGQQVVDAAGALKTKAGGLIDKVTPTLTKAGEQVTEAGEAAVGQAGKVGERLKGLFDFGKKPEGVDIDLDKMAAGQELGDTPDTIAAAEPTRMQKTKQWIDEMLGDVGVDDATRERLMAAADNLEDRATQTWVAGLAKAKNLAKQGKDYIDNMWQLARKSYTDAKAEQIGAGEGPKRSEMNEGLRSAIGDMLRPEIAGIEERHPGLLKDPDAVNKLADSVRMVIEMSAGTAQGKIGILPNEVIGHLQNTLGSEGFGRIMRQTFDLMKGDNVDPAVEERFFAQLSEISENDNRNRRLESVVRANLTDQALDSIKINQLPALIRSLREYAAGEHTRGMGKERARYEDAVALGKIRELFGDKTDVVLAAIEKERPKTEPKAPSKTEAKGIEGMEGGFEEDFGSVDRPTEQDVNAKIITKKSVMKPEKHHELYGTTSQAEEEIIKADIADPSSKARWVGPAEFRKITGKDPGRVPAGHGFVISEKIEDFDEIDMSVKGGVRFDSSKGNRAESKSVIDIGEDPDAKVKEDGTRPHILLDAIKLARVGERRAQRTREQGAADDRSERHRRGRVFMEAVAKVQDQLGRSFEIPDSTVIDNFGTTYGDVKKLGFSPPPSLGDTAQKIEKLTRQHSELAEKYWQAKAKGASREELASMIEQGKDLKADLDHNKEVMKAIEQRSDEDLSTNENIGEKRAEKKAANAQRDLLVDQYKSSTRETERRAILKQLQAFDRKQARLERREPGKQAEGGGGVDTAAVGRIESERADLRSEMKDATPARRQEISTRLKQLDRLQERAETRGSTTEPSKEDVVGTYSPDEAKAGFETTRTYTRESGMGEEKIGGAGALERQRKQLKRTDISLRGAEGGKETTGTGRYEIGPEEQIHTAVAGLGEGAVARKGAGPSDRTISTKEFSSVQEQRLSALRSKIGEFRDTAKGKPAAAVARRMQVLMNNFDVLSEGDANELLRMAGAPNINAVTEKVNDMARRNAGNKDFKLDAPEYRPGMTTPKRANRNVTVPLLEEARHMLGNSKGEETAFWTDDGRVAVATTTKDGNPKVTTYKPDEFKTMMTERAEAGKKLGEHRLKSKQAEGSAAVQQAKRLWNEVKASKSWKEEQARKAKAAAEAAAKKRGEEPPGPKAVAAKKAAFLERARSGDAELIKTIKASTDAKGLQRASETLASEPKTPEIARTIDAVNIRLGELVQDPDTSYGMNLEHQYTLDERGAASRIRAAIKVGSNPQMDAVINRGIDKAVAAMQAGKDVHEATKLEVAYLVKQMMNDNPQTAETGRWALSTLMHTLDQIEAHNKDIDTNRKLMRSLLLGKPNLGELMTVIGTSTKDRFVNVLARAIKQVAGKVPVERSVLGPSVNGLFDPTDGTIKVNQLMNNILSTTLHEGTHAATMAALADNPKLAEAFNKLYEHIAKADPDMTTAYGMTDVNELIAEGLSNPGFQAKLKTIPVSSKVAEFLGQNIANAWDAFVTLVRSALGIDPSHQNAFTQLLDLSGHAMRETALSGSVARPVERTLSRGSSPEMAKRASDTWSEVERYFKPGSPQLEAMWQISKDMKAEGWNDTQIYQAGQIAEVVLEHNPSLVEQDPDEMVYLLAETFQRLAGNVMRGIPSKVGSAKFSLQGVDPSMQGPVNRKAVEDYIRKVLGPSVQLEFSKMNYGGQFEESADGILPTIRLSIQSLNPMSQAYHESLHAFFSQLRDMQLPEVMNTLYRAANSAHVMKQLRSLLANEADALNQIMNDLEERVAYMYQFWAAGRLDMTPKAETIFQKLASYFRSVLGIWSNDQRALHIMGYFQSGEYAKNLGKRSAVSRALMEPGRNAALEQVKRMSAPLLRISEAVANSGGARIRDFGIDSLTRLADLVRRERTGTGEDSGFIPAARLARSRWMNTFAKKLEGMTQADLDQIVDGLQKEDFSGIQRPEARLAAKEISKLLNEDIVKYMKNGGVEFDTIKGGKYFPRVWDPNAIADDQKAFKAMLVKNGVKDPDNMVQFLMGTGGSEFGLPSDRPGMQHLKERTLKQISPEDAAPFLRKDLRAILSSYVNQATRRTEWARRFGDKSQVITDLLEKARKQGATIDQIETTRKYLRSVDGTLGDTIDPSTRKLFGNMIVYQNIRLLPLAIFSSLVDANGIIVRGGTVGDAWSTFKRGIKEMRNNFRKTNVKDADEMMAESLGVIDNAMMMHAVGDMYSESMVGDTTKAVNDKFFKYNLMEQWNRSMRIGASQAALKFLARHKTKPNEHSARFLDELGLEPSDIQLNQLGEISNIKDPKIISAVNRWVDGAILRPDATDKPIWMSDPHFALVAHLKQFVYSFQKTILERVAHEWRNGNYKPAMALAGYVPMMIAADGLKGLAFGGGDDEDKSVADYTWKGVQRAGLLGVGQFGLDVAGYGAVNALGGPTLEQFGDAINVIGGDDHFSEFAIKSMPANALYKEALL